MSYASLGAEAVMSLVEGHELVILGEGVDLFTLGIPKGLVGKTLEESAIGSETGLSAVGLKHQGQLVYNLHASVRFEATDELIVFGNVKQRAAFIKAFGA
jgi:K+/H+ antiporter YhaU regulatory subunit KhtT